MDRTSEFLSAVEAVRASKSGAPSLAQAQHTAAPHSKSQFNAAAADIGKMIHHTAAKITKLTRLAKRKGPFDDATAEIQQLTHIIKQDITGLNNQIGALQSDLQARKRGMRSHQAASHSERVVDSLKTQLSTTTKDFKSVLEIRTESLKHQQDRRMQFESAGMFSRSTIESAQYLRARRTPDRGAGSGSGSASAAGPGASGAGMGLAREPAAPRHFAPASVEDLESGGGADQEQQQAMVPQNRYFEARAKAMESVESTIGELSRIFEDLVTVVAEQGQLVERIDDNVENALSYANEGQNQLLTYLNNARGNRALIFKSFFVLLMFVIFWMTFLT